MKKVWVPKGIRTKNIHYIILAALALSMLVCNLPGQPPAQDPTKTIIIPASPTTAPTSTPSPLSTKTPILPTSTPLPIETPTIAPTSTLTPSPADTPTPLPPSTPTVTPTPPLPALAIVNEAVNGRACPVKSDECPVRAILYPGTVLTLRPEKPVGDWLPFWYGEREVRVWVWVKYDTTKIRQAVEFIGD